MANNFVLGKIALEDIQRPKPHIPRIFLHGLSSVVISTSTLNQKNARVHSLCGQCYRHDRRQLRWVIRNRTRIFSVGLVVIDCVLPSQIPEAFCPMASTYKYRENPSNLSRFFPRFWLNIQNNWAKSCSLGCFFIPTRATGRLFTRM